jgi:hypothetical protein
MKFLETFNDEFIKYKKEKGKGKGSQKFKAQSTDKKLKSFLDERGEKLKKLLETEASKDNNNTGFTKLPNSAKQYFGGSGAQAKIKREKKKKEHFKNPSKVDFDIILGPIYSFNEKNAIYLLKNFLKDKNFLQPGFIVMGEIDKSEAIKIFKGTSEIEFNEFSTIKKVFKNFNSLNIKNSENFPSWSAYGLFDLETKKFTIFVILDEPEEEE